MRDELRRELLAYVHGEDVEDPKALEAAIEEDEDMRTELNLIRAEEAALNRADGVTREAQAMSMSASRKEALLKAATQRAAGSPMGRRAPLPGRAPRPATASGAWPLRSRRHQAIAGGLLAIAAAVLLVLSWPDEQRVEDAVNSTPAPLPGAVQTERPSPPSTDDATSPPTLAAIDVVKIKPGTFIMGSPLNEEGRQDNEGPVKVTLTKHIAVMKTEVTQALWVEVMGDKLVALWRTALEGETDAAPPWDPQRPATHINWTSALRFANKLSASQGLQTCYELTECEGDAALGGETCHGIGRHGECNGWRLPTEAEWEYFARAGGEGAVQGWTTLQKVTAAQPVASLEPNAWGLHDTRGNALEWTWDMYIASLPGGTDPVARPRQKGPGGHWRVARGGAWTNAAGQRFNAHQWRAARRFALKPATRTSATGVRLVRNVPAQ